MKKKTLQLLYWLTFFSIYTSAQIPSTTIPPYNIKTISVVKNQTNIYPFIALGDSFSLQFDDLFGNESDYYFTITHHNYDWSPSDLSKNEYLDGIDNQRIQDYENSFNTLQSFSHYTLNFPNKFCQLTKSGNYIISILNNNKELVFTQKIIIYENLASVNMQVKRPQSVINLKTSQNIELSIQSQNILFQNPTQNLTVTLMQNGIWDTAITNLHPQYSIANEQLFRYATQTQFFAGNEYWYFDNKEIKIPTNNIAKVDAGSGLYNTYLYPNTPRKNSGYTYYPDINGNFQNRVLNAQNQQTETDYTWVYFSLQALDLPATSLIYVTGMFNNNSCTPENRLVYNPDCKAFEKAILIKQGFVNYQFTLQNSNNKIDTQNAIDGNYQETENQYHAIVYYKANGERYDRVIGLGETNSRNINN